MDVKFAWIPTWHSMDHVSFEIILKNHLLEVGPTQHHETMALRTLTVDLFTLECNVKSYVTEPSTKCYISMKFHSCGSSHMIK